MQRGDCIAHLLARADGDANAAVAAGIAGAVAHEHAGRAHAANKSACRAPMSTRTKLARLGQRRIPAASSAASNSARAAKHFVDVPVEIGCVFECGGQAGERERVDAVGREHAANPAHQFDGPGEHAEAQAGEAIGF